MGIVDAYYNGRIYNTFVYTLRGQCKWRLYETLNLSHVGSLEDSIKGTDFTVGELGINTMTSFLRDK